MTAPLQFQQHRSAGHVFQLTVLALPVPQRTEFLGQPSAAPIGILIHEALDVG